MDIAIFTQAAQLGGTVFTVVAFLWYLSSRDNKWTDSLKENSKANEKLACALQKLTDKIDFNSGASAINTNKMDENIEATVENTEAIKTNGNH